jgi:UDP-N-acetylglucosamine transferase subunit ALG13
MIKNDESLQSEFSDDAKYVTVEDDKVVESIIEDHLDTIDEIAKKLAENPSTLTVEEREDLEKKLEALKALKPQKDIDEDEYDPNTMEPLE